MKLMNEGRLETRAEEDGFREYRLHILHQLEDQDSRITKNEERYFDLKIEVVKLVVVIGLIVSIVMGVATWIIERSLNARLPAVRKTEQVDELK